MRELNDSGRKGEYTPPIVLRLGSTEAMTTGQVQTNSDDAISPDNAFPNPTGPS